MDEYQTADENQEAYLETLRQRVLEARDGTQKEGTLHHFIEWVIAGYYAAALEHGFFGYVDPEALAEDRPEARGIGRHLRDCLDAAGYNHAASMADDD